MMCTTKCELKSCTLPSHLLHLSATLESLLQSQFGWVVSHVLSHFGSLAPFLGEVVGELSSGAFSPNLDKNVAMGYLKKGYDKIGTPLKVVVRSKESDAIVAKMPFVPNRYYKGP